MNILRNGNYYSQRPLKRSLLVPLTLHLEMASVHFGLLEKDGEIKLKTKE